MIPTRDRVHGNGAEQMKRLDALTFQETATFLQSLVPESSLVVDSIGQVTAAEFTNHLTMFAKYITLRLDEDAYKRYQADQKESRLQ